MRSTSTCLVVAASLALAATSAAGVPAARATDAVGVPAELIHVIPVPAVEAPGHAYGAGFATPDGTLYLRRLDGSVRALPPGSDDLGPAVPSGCGGEDTHEVTAGPDGTLFASCEYGEGTHLHVTPADRSRPGWDVPLGTPAYALHATADGSLYFRSGGLILRLPRGAHVPVHVDDTVSLLLRGVDGAGHLYVDRGTSLVELVPGSATPVRELPGGGDVLVGEDGTVLITSGLTLTRYGPGSSEGTTLEGVRWCWKIAMASDGYIAAAGSSDCRTDSYSLRVWAPGAREPEKVIPVGSRAGAVAVAPGGQTRVSEELYVESTTGRTTTAPPAAPHVVGYLEDRGSFSLRYFKVVPGDHPAVPIAYTLDQQPQPRPAPSRDVNAPLPTEKMAVRPLARTADGRVVEGERVLFDLDDPVKPLWLRPLANGVPVLARILSGSPDRVELISGKLPPGIRIDGTGKIFGTPTANGAYNFTVGYRLPDGLPFWGGSRQRTVDLYLSVTDLRTRVTVSPQPMGPSGWTLVSEAFGSGGQRDEDLVDLRVLTGTSTFRTGLRSELVQSKYWEPGGVTTLAADGTEPIVLQARSARSKPYRIVLRPPGAPTSGSDLWVHLDSPADVVPGGLLTVELAAGNAGPDPVTGVATVVQLPAGATFTRTTCGGTDLGGGRLLLTKDGMASGQSVDCTLTVRAPQGTPGRSAAITAGISSLGRDPVPADDTARVTVSLRRP